MLARCLFAIRNLIGDAIEVDLSSLDCIIQLVISVER